MAEVFIIAEVGVNHNGSIEIAKKMINAACDAGVNAIKFQSFHAEKLTTNYTPKAGYQKLNTSSDETQLEMLKKLELSDQAQKDLFAQCRDRNILFISSPFDIESIDFLDKSGLEIFKIPSGEITNLPYLKKIGQLNRKVLLSTGITNLGEIEDALNIITSSGTDRNNITLLHCTSEYPAPFEEVNLLAIKTMKEAFKLPIGYSDHTQGIEASIAAVALGASVIEKHFTLDKSFEGPDHKSSLDTEELKIMVKMIRNIEKAMGNGIKKPSLTELKNREVVRKSIVASCNIKTGTLFSENNITSKRPGSGLSPKYWDFIIGKKATRDYNSDELIEL